MGGLGAEGRGVPSCSGLQSLNPSASEPWCSLTTSSSEKCETNLLIPNWQSIPEGAFLTGPEHSSVLQAGGEGRDREGSVPEGTSSAVSPSVSAPQPGGATELRSCPGLRLSFPFPPERKTTTKVKS